ncbi:MAG: hypothetical protein BGO68_04965 [Candidatus Amoebophilus sp. 36-38]|nr:MAG: hypothetical protein BGO68_04965 [Candidatus Amoebophilus sp. 36-38]
MNYLFQLLIYMLIVVVLLSGCSNKDEHNDLPDLDKKQQTINTSSISDNHSVEEKRILNLDNDSCENKTEKKTSRRRRKKKPSVHAEIVELGCPEQKSDTSNITNNPICDKDKVLQQRDKENRDNLKCKKSKQEPIRREKPLVVDPNTIDSSPNMVPLERFRDFLHQKFTTINSCEAYNKERAFIDRIIGLKAEVVKLSFNDSDNDKLYIINVFSSVLPCIQNLLGANFFDLLLRDDRIKLVHLFYDLNFAVAYAHLRLLTSRSYPLDQNSISKHANGYKQAKEQLRARFGLSANELEGNYLRNLSKIYNEAKHVAPQINFWIYPSERQNPPQRSRKFSVRMADAKRKSINAPCQQAITVTQNNKEKGSCVNTPSDIIDKFLDEQIKFIENLDKIHEPIDWVSMSNRFLELEKLGFSMVVSRKLSPKKANKNISDFTVRDWVKLYKNIRVCLPNFDIYGFIRAAVAIYIRASRLDEARIRLKAMECFCINKLNLSSKIIKRDFEIFQANASALCGEYDKLSELYQSEIRNKLARKKKLQEKHQQQIEKIKNAQKTQTNSDLSNPISIKTIQTKVLSVNTPPCNELLSDAVYQENQQRQKKEAEDRLDRHQRADNERKQKNNIGQPIDKEIDKQKENLSIPQIQEVEIHPTNSPDLEDTSSIHFYLHAKAYTTISKIFANDWKIKRNDIEHLFDELGQHINIETKSSHHIIKIAQSITLVNQDGQIIGIITDLSANASGHLSLPNWKNEVPFYIQSQVQHLLRLIGIYDENCFKATQDNHTQCIPIINDKSKRISQNKPNTGKEKKKRRKRSSIN